MLSAYLAIFLGAMFLWHAWHRDIEFMPRMSRPAVILLALLPWQFSFGAWRDLAQIGTLRAIATTIGTVVASASVLALDHRYGRLERSRRRD